MKDLIKIDLIGDPLVDLWNDGDTLNYYLGGAANVASNILSLKDSSYDINFTTSFKFPWIFGEITEELKDFDLQDKEDFPGKLYLKVEDNWISKNLPSHPLDCHNVQISDMWNNSLDANYSILVISNYNKGFVQDNLESLLKDKKYNLCILDDRYAVTNLDILRKHINVLVYRYTKHADLYIGDVWDYCLQTNGSEEVIFGNKEKEPLLKIKPYIDNPISTCGAGDVATATLAMSLAQSIYKEEMKFLEHNFYFSYRTLDDLLCDSVEATQIACGIAVQRPYTCTIKKEDLILK